MEPPVTTAMFLGTGKVIGFVVHGEPTPPDASIVQLDHFRHARTQTGFHKVAEHTDILGQKVQVINAARWYACKAARHILGRDLCPNRVQRYVQRDLQTDRRDHG